MPHGLQASQRSSQGHAQRFLPAEDSAIPSGYRLTPEALARAPPPEKDWSP